MHTYINCNPYDDIDNKIKYTFFNNFGLQLNKIHYNLFGIIDDFYLISLLGESKVFEVYLGYKLGSFFSVKIMKRSKYDSKEDLNSKIMTFNHEFIMRQRLSKLPNCVKMFELNPEKFILYEECCINGKLTYFAQGKMSEVLIRTIFNKLLKFTISMHNLRISHNRMCLDNILLDINYELKVIGFKDSSEASINSTSDLYLVQDLERLEIQNLGIILCELLFKGYNCHLMPFLIEENSLDYSLFEKILDEVIKSNFCDDELADVNSLKKLIFGVTTSKYVKDLEKFNWVNESILEPEDYYYEMSLIRDFALKMHFEEISVKEQKLINKKKGIFKVIK